MTNKIQINLVKKATGNNYSIEAGLHDGFKNFDHHDGTFDTHKMSDRNYSNIELTEPSKYEIDSFSRGMDDESSIDDIYHAYEVSNTPPKRPPSPCNNSFINPISDMFFMSKTRNDEIIEISHLDADTFIGLSRLLNKDVLSYGWSHDERYGEIYEGRLNTELIEEIDIHGSSILDIEEMNCPEYAFMVGLSEIARERKFPRLTENQDYLDVTKEIMDIFEFYSTDDIIEKGRDANAKSEKAYKDCKLRVDNVSGMYAYDNESSGHTKGLWIVNDNSFDPSRPYKDNIEIVVVYRAPYQTMSIYCKPSTDYNFAGKEIEGIKFAGHSKACGSPRGESISIEKAKEVYKFI